MEEQTVHTTEDIVASLLTPAAPDVTEKVSDEVMALAPDTDPEVEASTQSPSGEDEAHLEGDEEIALETEADLPTEEAEVEEEDEEVEQTAAATDDFLDINDDDLIEVSIDGKIEYRTVKEAKAALSLDGATQSRLQEATETRNSINVERDEMRLKLEDQRGELVSAISQLSGQLFQPTVPAPDEALRVSNPAHYIQQSDAYIAEQAAIVEKQAALKQYVADQNRQQQENMQVYRDQQQVILHAKIPELADPQQTPVVAKKIMDAAKSYGFHENEIGLAYDHRLFLMALDASKYQALQRAQGVTTPEDTAATVRNGVRNTPRKLRSGVAARKTEAKSKAKARAKTREKAMSSGKTTDVVDFILSNN